MRDTFLAIDFETADHQADSACAVGLVRVEGLRIVERVQRLIRPPRQRIMFTYIHGIQWQDVADQPTFQELWPELAPMFEGVGFLAAHNAHFDRRVLYACCGVAGVVPPLPEFLCTVELARATWGIFPTKLPDVCRRLQIDLKHHEALSDAEACARIVIQAMQTRAAENTLLQ